MPAVRTMGFAALIMAGSVFLSRLMGLFRDKVISWQFGAGSETDIYFSAFVVPDFINHLLAGGYLAITLIPLLSRRFSEDPDDGQRFFSAVFCWASAGVCLLSAIAWIAAPQLASAVSPGFTADQTARLSTFLRIILSAQIFFVPGSCFTALLYMHKQFWVPALTPLIYNGCIIAGGLFLPFSGMEGFCWGVPVGAAIGAFLLPAAAVFRTCPVHIRLIWYHPFLKKLILLALPLMIGISLTALDEQFIRIFGSLADTGSVSELSYARRIMLVPVGVVAQAAGVASFPFLTSLLSKGDEAGFTRTLNKALCGSALFVMPLTAYMIAAAEPTLGFLFEGGRFSTHDTASAAPLLRLFLLAVPLWTIQQIISRGFYARQNTLTPAIIGSIVTLFAVPFYIAAAKIQQAPGVAAMTTAALGLYTVLLCASWKYRYGTENTFCGLVQKIAISFGLSLPAGAVAYAGTRLIPQIAVENMPLLCQQAPALIHAFSLGISSIVFGIVYVISARLIYPQAVPFRIR